MTPLRSVDLRAKRLGVRVVRELVKRGWPGAAQRATAALFPRARVRAAGRERGRFPTDRVVHVLDARLFDGVGHFLNMNVSIREAVDGQPGWRCLFYGRLDLDARVEAALPAHPFFVKGARWGEHDAATPEKEPDPSAAAGSTRGLKTRRWVEFNRRRLCALAEAAIRRDDVVLVHTLGLSSQSMPSTLARWIRSLPPERTPRFVINFMLPHYIGSREDELQPDFVELFEALSQLPKEDVVLISETAEMRDDLAKRTGGNLTIGLAPHLKPEALLRKIVAGRESVLPGHRPCVGYAGHARHDRGAHLVPEVLRRLAEQGVDARFRVHAHDRADSCIDLFALERLRGLELRIGMLEIAEYYRFVSGIDVMLLPFKAGLRTQLQGSGVFWECLAMGQVMVLPRFSHFEKEARRVGAGFTTFGELEPEAVAEAARQAVEGFEELSARSRQAAPRWLEERSAVRFFEGILGGAGGAAHADPAAGSARC